MGSLFQSNSQFGVHMDVEKDYKTGAALRALANGEELLDTADYPGERRLRAERRRFGFATVFRGVTHTRRRKTRRMDDHHRFHLDWHGPWVLVTTLAVLILSALDAALTLTLLSLGALELNPLMDALIKRDVDLFVTAKLALTSVGLILLVMHANFRVFRVVKISHVLVFSLACYVGVTVYEVILLRQLLAY